MKRWLGFRTLGLFLGSLIALLCFAGGVSHAQTGGGIGSGGDVGGGGGSNYGDPGYAHTTFGWGWLVYDINSTGPRYGLRSGTSWATIQATCRGYTTSVAVFTINDAFGDQQGYNYRSYYYTPATYGGYRFNSPYIPVPTAEAAYNALTVDKTGFTWGVNVGWFCYGAIVNNSATLDGIHITDSAGNWLDVATYPVTVSISGAGADSSNPFFFNGSAGHGSTLAMGTATSTVRTVSISGVPSGWMLAGYAICEDSAPPPGGCTAAWLINNIASPGTTSFNQTFLAGRSYHMRWMFQRNAATCSVHTFPVSMLVGENGTFTVRLSMSHWDTARFSVGNPALAVQVRGPQPSTTLLVNNTNVNYTVSGNDPATITSSPIAFTPPTHGRYEMQWSMTGAGLSDVFCPGGNNGSWSNPVIGEAGYKPYFVVTGGDIISGGDIRSWNRDNVNGLGYGGAGTTLAAIATGNIQNFVTGGGLPAGAATRAGSGLGFANSTASGTTYGGGFATTPFTPTVSGTTVPWGLGTLNLSSPTLVDNTTYTYAGNLTLTGQLPTGKNITIVLTSGNAIISGNTTYGAYGSPGQIPRLTLMVQAGNIYVDSAVTEMHGVYSASGNFYSCANGVTPIDLTAATSYATCGNRLTVYGAVAANRLVLGRTTGSLVAVPAAGVTVVPAEEFFYSPELWLAEGGNGTTSSTVNYDTYLTLPPVL